MPGPMGGGPRRGDPNGHDDKPKNFGKAIKDLISYCKKYIPVMLGMAALSGVASLLSAIGPTKVKDITNLIEVGLETGVDTDAIARTGIILVILYTVSGVLSWIQSYVMAAITQKISFNMRGDIARKVNRLPVKYFGENSFGDVLSRVTNDVDTVGQTLSSSIASMVSSMVTLVACLYMMIKMSGIMTLTSIAATIVGFGFMSVILANSQKHFTRRQKAFGDLTGYAEEAYSGHDIVRVSNAQEKVEEEFELRIRNMRDASYKAQFMSGLMQPLMGFTGNLGYVAVCIVGAALAVDGKLDFGTIIAFVLYVRMFSSPLSQIAQNLTSLQQAAAAGERVFEFLGEEELEDESDKTRYLDPALVKGSVEFENVKFAYPEAPDRIIINDFSASIKPGQTVAIVGPTGAGKTTVVNLLMRFYEPLSGKISIDGIPINKLTRENVHDLFGMVLQDTWLFEGSVRDNLLYGRDDVDYDELKRVCKICGVHHFIKSLPQGYDTVLSDATAISAGQKQLLTIARAMLENAPLLILDEATSSVDTRTEKTVQRAMDRLTKDRTSFIIAHRLSTIRDADIILVMKDGDIVEQGNHNELLARNGFYATLYNSQFAGMEI